MASADITAIDPQFSFAPQIYPESMVEIAAAGYRSVLNARPDHEGGEEQPTSSVLGAAAASAKLAYAYLPVVPSEINEDTVTQFAALIAELPKPILGFCLSGKRAARLYQLATTR